MPPDPPPALVPQDPKEFFRRKARGRFSFFRAFLHQAAVVPSLIGLLLIGLHAGLLWGAPLERLERVLLDSFFRLRPAAASHPSIVYVEIAEDSVQAIGRWPWPRHYHAVLAHLLRRWGARAVVFDMIFSEPSTFFDDGAFAQALEENPRCYLPVVLEADGTDKIWIHSLPQFENAAIGNGHINVLPDPDGVVRRIPAYLSHAGEQHPSLAMRVAFDFLQRPVPPPESAGFPLDSHGNLLVNWAGPWKEAFAHYSYLDLLRSFEAFQNGRAPMIPPEKIEGKICLVGLTAVGLGDIKAVPVGAAYPGLGIQANLIQSFLTGRFILPVSRRVNALCLLAVGLAALAFLVPFRNAFSLGAGIFLVFSWIGGCFLLFWKWGLWLYVVHPVFLILSQVLVLAVYSGTIGKREELRLFQLATRDGLTGLYVIRHFRQVINDAVLKAQRRKEPLAVILIDIDHFKRFNDTYGHPAGDAVLRHVAGIIASCAKGEDRSGKDAHVVARYGGEEMILLLRNMGLPQAAQQMAEPIRKAVEGASLVWEKHDLQVTISLGVGALHSGESVPDLVIARADQALYRAKESGRNRVCTEETNTQ